MITIDQSRELGVLIRSLTPMQKADFYYFTIVKNEDPYEFLSSLDVQKHQQHDQSTHGSWAGTNQITSEQKKAVQAYTQKIGDVTQWRSVAQNIRDGKTPDAPPEFVSSVKTLLNAIDEHSVTPTNAGGKVLLRSGVNWKGKLPVVGEIMSNPVASATWRHNVAEKFASSGDGKPVIIKYGSSTKGLDVSKFGADLFGGEGEFIVSGKFEVVDRDNENGFTYVSLRAVGDVTKHQQHDQSSHGNWAGEGGTIKDFKSAYKNFTLTEDEEDALSDYGSSGYKDINNFLRLGVTSSNSQYQDYLSQAVKSIDNAIDRAPLVENNNSLWRVFSPKAFLNLEIGKTYKDKGFMSTSLNDLSAKKNSEVKDNFMNVGGISQILGKILPNKNYKGISMNNTKVFNDFDEREFILPRNTKLTFLGFEQQNTTDDFERPIVENIAVFQREN